METLLSLFVFAGIGGIFYFRKKDKKKRNISIIVAVVSFLLFGLFSELQDNEEQVEEEIVQEDEEVVEEEAEVEEEVKEEIVEEDDDEEIVEDENAPTYEYTKIEDEKSEVSDFKRFSIRAVTDEKLSKDQIEVLLKKIEKDIKYNKKKDQVYIFLSENEKVAENGYSLGRLVHKDNKTEIDSSEKNWDEQPTNEDYKLYGRFMDKSLEMSEAALKEDGDAYVEDDEIAEEVAKEEGTDSETVSDSTTKVNSFVFSGQ